MLLAGCAMTPPAVPLGPGATAYAVVEIQRGEADCDSSDTGGLRIEVVPRGFSVEAVFADPPVAFCAGGDRLGVGAFSADRQPEPDAQPNG